MLLTKEVEVGINKKYKNRWKSLGYDTNVPFNSKIKVSVKDLSAGSNVHVDVQCDYCGNIIKNVIWQNYLKYIHEDGVYYCQKCALRMFGKPKERRTKLNNGKSFKQWCLDNGQKDILNRWDSELNHVDPDQILSNTHIKYYFRCPCNFHESELFAISFITNKKTKLKCNKCNSFAQFLLNKFGVDGIDLYWSNKNLISPWDIAKYSNKKVWMNCGENNCTNCYQVTCGNFVHGSRCPICNISKGEKKIQNYLDSNNLFYIYQKTFDGLIGVNKGLLSYDFFLPNYNLLIEYQGQFHDGEGNNYRKQNIGVQKEHDKRKYLYAQNHNITLLEIWYWNFDKIEKILKEKLGV